MLLLGLALSGCSACSSSKNGGVPDLGPNTRLYFVAEDGRDEASGTRDAPFRSIGRAMDAPEVGQIFVSAGRYPEAALRVVKSLEIIGPGAGQARLEGHLEIAAPSVSWSGIDVSSGLVVENAPALVLKDTMVSPGTANETVLIAASSGHLSNLRVICGSSACMQVDSSTLSVTQLRLGPDEGKQSDRVLRVSSSSVAISNIEAWGGSVTQVQADGNTDLTIRSGTLGPRAGTQLVANLGAKVRAFDLLIPEPGQLGALAARGELRLVRTTIGNSNNICTGTQGGRLVIEQSDLGACAFGSVTAANFNDVSANVFIRGGVIRHGRHVGVNLSQGRVEIEGTRFEGVADYAEDGDDAILANSSAADLMVRRVTIENATGNGIGVYDGAKADLSAVITNPRLGGIFIGAAVGGQVRIRGAEVRGCRGGSGLVVYGSVGVSIETSLVSSCSEAGLLAGESSEVSVDNGTFENNGQFGVAAFGQSTITLNRSVARGSPWAVFASCGDGSRIEDAADNRFEGPVTDCF